MNLNVREWKEFLAKDIFDIKYGVNLELNACEESNDKDAVNFVSRTEDNNGVSAKVRKIDSVNVQKAGLITVAGGGSVLSTFVQPDDFYSGRDLYTLDVKATVSEGVKHFLVTVITLNKYKYNYGRQANKTLPFLELKLPIQHNPDRTPYIDPNHTYSEDGYVPDWQFMEDYMKSLHHKPLTTKNTVGNGLALNVDEWKEFRFGDLIDKPYKAKAFNKDDLEIAVKEGLRYITRTGVNNGCEMIVNASEIPQKYVEKGNAISIGDTTATCFYQDEDFITGDHMVIVRAKWLNRSNGLFVVGMLQNEQYKYSYGRAFLIDRIQETMMKLPIQHNPDGTPYIDCNCIYSEDGYVPDWQFMEDYMKALPYGDRL